MLVERSATIASGAIRYLEAGAGWPVVLLHAFPLCADMWRPQLERAPADWRLLAPDLRGFGPVAGGAAASLDEMAADVADWLDVLRIDRPAIGGLSMGGYVSFALFRRQPERFTGLILANTKATADSEEGRAGRDKMSARVRADGPAAVADDMIPKLLGESSRAHRPDLADTVRRLILANRTDGIDGAIQAMKNRPDSSDLLPRVTCPALVVAGEEDGLIPIAESEAMHRLLPRSQLVALPRAGHLSNMEAPDEFSAALANFLQAKI